MSIDQISTDSSHVATSIRDYMTSGMSSPSAQALTDDDNIFELGFVTSLFAMQLLDFVEEEFSVEIPDDEITLANFSSVARLTALVTRLRDDHAA
ncbi:phosphopantetheine-binding protein [Microbacterium sp.]|uniref:phosphopantetheine-binding protein n=1 Tax=Microbacterium sp. TaxID=51671 RepID=UPI0026043B7E|nr:phosphopantetheine-binding protein [Microbacterium sp.]